MKYHFEKNSTSTILIIGVFALHIAFYWLPLVNLEWAFSDAALFFETQEKILIDRYFSQQANTLGIPYLAYLVHKIIPIFNIELAPRFLSISGFILLGVSLIRLNSLTGKSNNQVLLLILVFLNPLIWTFGGRGTADFFPAILALFSITLFLDKKPHLLKMTLAIFTFSIAITLKYHAILLLPVIWLEAITRTGQPIKIVLIQMILITTAILIIPALYIYFIQQQYGFWLTPPIFQDTHQLRISSAFSSFISYAGFLTLLLLPFSIFLIWNRIHSLTDFVKTISIAVIFFLAGYFFIESNNEMNFGPLDPYLGAQFTGGILCLCAGLFFLTMIDGLAAIHDNNEAKRILICIMTGILIFIVVLSFTRPAQRYLLFILPLAYLFISHHFRTNKLLVASIILLSIFMNTYILISQYAAGKAALELTQKLEKLDLISTTNPAFITSYTGNAFPLNMYSNKRNIVIVGQHPKQLFYVENSPLPFIRKTFSVIPIEHYGK